MRFLGKRAGWFVVFLLGCFAIGLQPAQGGWRNNPVTISHGELNPEFSGAKFNRFLVSTINVPPDFRDKMEFITAALIGRYMKDRWRGAYDDVAVGFRKLFPGPTAFQPEKHYEVQDVLNTIDHEKIDVLVLINIINEGGRNIQDVDSLPSALEYSANYVHDASPVKSYRFCKITLFDIRSGKKIWKGDGIVKAKPGTTNWYHDSATTLGKKLVAYLKKDGVLQQKSD